MDAPDHDERLWERAAALLSQIEETYVTVNEADPDAWGLAREAIAVALRAEFQQGWDLGIREPPTREPAVRSDREPAGRACPSPADVKALFLASRPLGPGDLGISTGGPQAKVTAPLWLHRDRFFEVEENGEPPQDEAESPSGPVIQGYLRAGTYLWAGKGRDYGFIAFRFHRGKVRTIRLPAPSDRVRRVAYVISTFYATDAWIRDIQREVAADLWRRLPNSREVVIKGYRGHLQATRPAASWSAMPDNIVTLCSREFKNPHTWNMPDEGVDALRRIQ